MLAWALWLAMAVLSWLRWGWQSLNVGGLWMKRPPKEPGSGGLFSRKKVVETEKPERSEKPPRELVSR